MRDELRIVLWLAALSVLFIRGLLAQEEGGHDAQRLSFPGNFGLDTKWEALQASTPEASVIQSLVQEDFEGKNVIACGDRRYASVWSAVDRQLAQQPDALPPLRLLEDADAPTQLAAARRANDFGRLCAVCRRYPWADAVHAALLDSGEQMLREGHAGLALRSFQDALRHSINPATRARAQSALWLAAAQLAQSPRDIDALMRNVKPEAEYSWFGKPTAAKAIEAQLKAGMPPAEAAAALKSLQVQAIGLPSEPAWVVQIKLRNRPDLEQRDLLLPSQVQPVAGADGLLVAGPNLLAWYAGGSLQQPRWTQVFPCDVSLRLWGVVAPGPFQPAVAEGRIYTRWGIEQGQPNEDDHGEGNPWAHRLKDIAALDCARGHVLWSTSGNAAWRELCPVNDPAYADGRLYVLAIANGREYCPMFLVALDARCGSVLWKRELAAAHTTLQPMQYNQMNAHAKRALRNGKLAYRNSIDVVHYGNAVTVADGAVYCSTNLGAVARCDARDGLIEWIATYPQNPAQADLSTLVSRQGAPPRVIGQRVLFTPRDTTALFAVDRETGATAWQETGDLAEAAANAATADPTHANLQSDEDLPVEMIATLDDRVVATAGRRIAALEVDSGKPKWGRTLDEPLESPAWMIGSMLYANTHSKLLQIDAVTGATVSSRAWQTPLRFAGVALREKTLFVIQPSDGGIARENVSEVEREPKEHRHWPSERLLRWIYRSAQPPALDGDPSKWEPENTTIWRDPAGGEGKAWFAHDATELYLGISHPAQDAQPRQGRGPNGGGDWLELQLSTFNRETMHWALFMDGCGRATWENLGSNGSPVPEAAQAVIAHQEAHCRLTYEIAIPLASLMTKEKTDLQKYDGWRNLSVHMALHADGRGAGQPGTSQEVGGVTEMLQLQRGTLAENQLLQSLARQFPDLDESWQFLFQAWQGNAPAGAKPSEFYRQYIEQHPNAPELKTAQARLEQLLKNDSPQGVQSLRPADPAAYLPKKIMMGIGSGFSHVHYCDYVAQLWRRADALLAGDPTQRTAFRKEILLHAPPAEVPQWLGKFYRVALDEKDCVPELEKLIEECRLGENVLADFRQSIVHCFLRDWRVIGPLATSDADGRDAVCPVEQEPVALERPYDGLQGKVAWQPLHAERPKIDLSNLFTPQQPGAAYAVCWVESPQPKATLVEVGSNDGIQVWVNRKRILAEEVHRQAEPGQTAAPAHLVTGWNEILVKVENGFGPCCFFLELRDAATGKPCEGLKVRASN
jgi:outer membrane protein assembly factor BamB